MIEHHPAGPVDLGHRLATIPRGPRAELRVTLVDARDSRTGEPFVRLRVGAVPEGRPDGDLWPVPGRTLTVGLDEAGAVADALAGVVAMARG